MPSVNVNLSVDQLNVLLFVLRKQANDILNEISYEKNRNKSSVVINDLIDEFRKVSEIKDVFIH